MRIKIAGTANDSIVDGPGLRYAVFTQGCPHNCVGCHNPDTHDPNGGKWANTADLLAEMAENVLLDGLTLSGGEPFEQPEACLELALGAKELGLNVWTFTGATLEQLIEVSDADQLALLESTDVLVDGPFIQNQRTLELRFRGSKNQRLLDARRSAAEKRAIYLEGAK